jgi:hypothetical protein
VHADRGADGHVAAGTQGAAPGSPQVMHSAGKGTGDPDDLAVRARDGCRFMPCRWCLPEQNARSGATRSIGINLPSITTWACPAFWPPSARDVLECLVVSPSGGMLLAARRGYG